MLCCHVKEFMKLHYFWGMLSEQFVESLHRIVNGDERRFSSLGSRKNILQKIIEESYKYKYDSGKIYSATADPSQTSSNTQHETFNDARLLKMWDTIKLDKGFSLAELDIRDALLEIRVVNSISFANFDAEIGAYSTFAEVFPGVSVKLCSFHVKQGLYRKVQSSGLSQDYETNEDLQKFVRMLGALQITPIVEWLPCLELLRHKVNDGTFHRDLSGKLEELLVYFENTWLSRGEIFCLFGYTGPRTTNHAESYHGKQRHHFSMNAKLGHWAVSYRQLTHTEELDAYDVFEGRQPPRRQGTDCMEITAAILELKDKLLEFLSSDDGLLQGERYARKMDRYLSRIGRLMGINSLEFREVMQEDNDDEEDAREAAVQHDEGGEGTQEFPEEEAYPNVIFDAELNVYRLA